MKEKKVSIIVPIYNMEKYLKKCIESILNQEYKNFELLLNDEGSTDNSLKICNEYKSKDNRVKVCHKKNGGVSSSRNKGLLLATGEYIGFVDPDDYIHPEMYLKLVDNIEKYNADLSICGNNDLYEDGTVSHEIKSGILEIIDSDECLKKILNETKYLGTCWNKLYKKNLFNNISFNEKRRISEDLEVMFQLIPKCNKIVYDSTPLYYWIIHNNSTIHRKFIENKDKWDDEINLCEMLIEKSQKQNTNLVNYAIKRYVRVNIFCISRIIHEKESKKLINIYKNNIMKYYKTCMSFTFVKKTFKIKLLLIKINPYLIKLYNILCMIKARRRDVF